MELEENIAYEMNVEEGEIVSVTAPDNQLPNIFKDANNEKSVVNEKKVATVAIFALFLASLGLLAAAVEIYLSTHGTEIAKSSSQDNLQSVYQFKKRFRFFKLSLMIPLIKFQF